MENVPWHEEVLGFVQQLVDRLPHYEISCEHEHSNCVLVTHTKFKDIVNNSWNTWIDYTKFHELVKEYNESNGQKTFGAMDYMAPTPDWATFGSEHRGFDPHEKRFHRKRNHKTKTEEE